MTIPFVNLRAQYRALQPEIDAAIQGVLGECNFILGAPVREFEDAFAQFVNARHAVGVSSGLEALRLALFALGIKPGDEVILPANTFIATALAVSQVGAQPVLVDCDPRSYILAVDELERAITSRTKAIIPVHLAGQCADMDAVLAVAARHHLVVIEDAAQAHGALYQGRPCGSLAAAGCFSFYPGKNLGAYGDGGLIAINDAELAERLRRLRHYGQRAKYDHVELGTNARLDTLQAAVLNVKLRYLRNANAARWSHAQIYRQCLAGVGDLGFQQEMPYSTHVYHLFIIETSSRDALQSHLHAAGIETGIHYPIPLHLQPAYRHLGYIEGVFPQSERLAKMMLSLPLYPELTEAQLEEIVSEIRFFFQKVKLRTTVALPNTGPCPIPAEAAA